MSDSETKILECQNVGSEGTEFLKGVEVLARALVLANRLRTLEKRNDGEHSDGFAKTQIRQVTHIRLRRHKLKKVIKPNNHIIVSPEINR